MNIGKLKYKMDNMEEEIRSADDRYYDTLLPESASIMSYDEQLQKVLEESQKQYSLEQIELIEKKCAELEKQKIERNELLQPIMRYWKYSEISKNSEIYKEINTAMESFKNVETDKIYLYPETYYLFAEFLKGISSRIDTRGIQDILESF